MLMMLNQLTSRMITSSTKLLICCFVAISFLTKEAKAQNIMVDVIYLKSDTCIKGRLNLLLPQNSVSIIDFNDSLHIYKMSEVEKIRKELIPYTPDDLSKETYFSIGGSMGYPSILNFRAGFHSKNHFVFLTGNYLYFISGIQANYGYNLLNNYRFSHGPTAYVGFNNSSVIYSSGKHNIFYYGLGYKISFQTIYTEFGYGLFEHTTSQSKWINPGWTFQIGLIHKIIDPEYKEKRPIKNFY